MAHYRSLFLSDIHLGTYGCQADQLLEFIRHNSADQIYLVGDIVDGWQLKKRWYWPQSHNDVVQKLLRQVRKGARITYIPGNHDEFLRRFPGHHFGGIQVQDRVIHETADGRRFLVIHGDQFDIVVRHAKWLAHLGDWAYDAALTANIALNRVRRGLGLSYWSLSRWAKLKVKNAVSFIGDYESALADAAAEDALDGVICGHIHHAVIGERGGIEYVNTGDWVESCTAVAEHADGRLELIHWTEERQRRMKTSAESRESEEEAVEPLMPLFLPMPGLVPRGDGDSGESRESRAA